MRIALALLLAAGLAFIARADDPKPTTPPPAAAPAAAAPAAPAAPKGMPVPTGEVVKKTEMADGLLAEDLKIGDGVEVGEGWTVTAFYHGTLKSDGKVFDSAFERGQPATFPLPNVIPGWQKGVPGMKVGGIRRLTIPAALAYADHPPSPAIPAGADLVFIVQVVDTFDPAHPPVTKIEDIKAGEGEACAAQCVAVTRHVAKTADGKVVEEVSGNNLYIWFPGENQGMLTAFEGMKIGGKRKITIPKQLNLNSPALETIRPQNVELTIELELVSFRNLPQQQPRH